MVLKILHRLKNFPVVLLSFERTPLQLFWGCQDLIKNAYLDKVGRLDSGVVSSGSPIVVVKITGDGITPNWACSFRL